MQAESAFQWSAPLLEFVGFVSLFLANGAVGFRYAVVRGGIRRSTNLDAAEWLYQRAARQAAVLGLLGALVEAVLFVTQLPHLAQRAHLSTGRLLTTDPVTLARWVLLLGAIVGFALAMAGRWPGWLVAAVGMIGSELAVILSGRWAGLVNPLHQLFAGLWLGTLAVLVLAGIPTALSGPARLRGPVVAKMVNGFSPLALVCGPLLVLTGVTTALLHLRPFSSLWTTPYGYTLLAKLCLVAVVFSLGAWNWRRQRPRLGSEEAAAFIRRSSVWEVSLATLVLAVTAVLVSLPAPRPPQGPGRAPAPAATSGKPLPPSQAVVEKAAGGYRT
jgi:putative copper export protein